MSRKLIDRGAGGGGGSGTCGVLLWVPPCFKNMGIFVFPAGGQMGMSKILIRYHGEYSLVIDK